MAGMLKHLAKISLLWVLTCITEVSSTFCYYSYYSISSYRRVMYCSYGCCGYYYSRRCCSGGGTIAGSVVGGLAFIAIVVGIVICCVMSHKRGLRGGRGIFGFGQRHNVPMATGGTTVSIVHSQNVAQPMVAMQPTQYSNPAYPSPVVGPAQPAPPAYGPVMPPPYNQHQYPAPQGQRTGFYGQYGM